MNTEENLEREQRFNNLIKWLRNLRQGHRDQVKAHLGDFMRESSLDEKLGFFSPCSEQEFCPYPVKSFVSSAQTVLSAVHQGRTPEFLQAQIATHDRLVKDMQLDPTVRPAIASLKAKGMAIAAPVPASYPHPSLRQVMEGLSYLEDRVQNFSLEENRKHFFGFLSSVSNVGNRGAKLSKAWLQEWKRQTGRDYLEDRALQSKLERQVSDHDEKFGPEISRHCEVSERLGRESRSLNDALERMLKAPEDQQLRNQLCDVVISCPGLEEMVREKFPDREDLNACMQSVADYKFVLTCETLAVEDLRIFKKGTKAGAVAKPNGDDTTVSGSGVGQGRSLGLSLERSADDIWAERTRHWDDLEERLKKERELDRARDDQEQLERQAMISHVAFLQNQEFIRLLDEEYQRRLQEDRERELAERSLSRGGIGRDQDFGFGM